MAEPVTLAEAKAHLRVLDTSEDGLITALIVAARESVENYTGHILARRAVTQTFHRFTSYLQLDYRPIVTVDSINYTDTLGATAAYTGFVTRLGYPTRVFPALDGWWPSLGRNGAIQVTYTAGYAAGEEPQALIQAMLLLISHWFHNREASAIAAMNEAPFAVTALCDQYRVPV